jgi:hypothetical protein
MEGFPVKVTLNRASKTADKQQWHQLNKFKNKPKLITSTELLKRLHL